MAKKKQALKQLDYHDYISDDGLNGLKILEGHKKTEKVWNEETKKYELTGLYGIKESSIKEVKRYAKERGYAITPEMEKVKTPSDLTEQTARDFAGFYAWRNFERADQLTENHFREVPSHQRDVLLTYFHNMSLEKLSKNKGNNGSILSAIEVGDADEVIKALFTREDGTYGTYEGSIARNRRGLMNRNMATAQWYYNPDAEVVSSFSKRDEYYRDVYPTKGYLDRIIKGAENMQDIRKKNRNIDANNDWAMFSINENYKEPEKQAIAEPKMPQEASFLEKLGKIGMAAINPIYGMVQQAMDNQLANTQENMLNSNNGVKK